MYEIEIRHSVENGENIPENIREQFLDTGLGPASLVSVAQWEEHCTECAMPMCYQTCDLYEPRSDGKCRRFLEGITPVTGIENEFATVKIRFKKWGSLMATNHVFLVDRQEASRLEESGTKLSNWASSSFFNGISLLGRKGIPSRIVRRLKSRLIDKSHSGRDDRLEPDCFRAQIYNPENSDVQVTFVIRAEHGEKNKIPFQQLLILSPGFHQIRFPYSEIRNHIDPEQKHFISFTPNFVEGGQREIGLYFGFIGFVSENLPTQPGQKTKSIKVVAWDLDNTMWNGVLVEDGADALKLKPGIKEVIETLDSRGIVNSVVSKNNHDEAWNQLKEFGIDHLFVFPKISWGPKSTALREMIDDFNVGDDTIAFIDDSPFERREVKSALPMVDVFDASEYLEILNKPAFTPPLSTESAGRREFYKSQGERKQHQSGFSGEYFDFLKSCNIFLTIQRAAPHHIDRIYELVQRTNQLNFSGNRYDREQIEVLISDPSYDNYCMICADKFGDYGTVGFSIIDHEKGILKDMMFSCRIQSKRVEHAFIGAILNYYHDKKLKAFTALYNKTTKNAPAGQVFDDLQFSLVENEGDHFIYKFELDDEIPDDGLIQVTFDE